jgi:hypothetical protein
MLYTNPFLFLKYENDHNIKITGLALLGGLSGRFLSGYIAWNVFYLRNNQKYSLNWYLGHTLLNLGMITGFLYVPITYNKYIQN